MRCSIGWRYKLFLDKEHIKPFKDNKKANNGTRTRTFRRHRFPRYGSTHCFLYQLFLVLAGKVTEGLILHPDNEHMISPLGTTIVVRHIISRTQQFLRGHDNDISVITVSNTGKYIASGQRTHQGFQVKNISFRSPKTVINLSRRKRSNSNHSHLP